MAAKPSSKLIYNLSWLFQLQGLIWRSGRKNINIFFLFNLVLAPSGYLTHRHLLTQNQKWKHENKEWNLLKDSNKDTSSVIWRNSNVFVVNVEQISSLVSIVDFEQEMPTGE